MKLVNADFVTDEEKAIQRLFQDNPGLLFHVAQLLNSYREIIDGYLDNEELDPSDTLRSCTKNENSMRRLGIPILETLDDWQKLREHYHATRQS